jgi:hypothetical protein
MVVSTSTRGIVSCTGWLCISDGQFKVIIYIFPIMEYCLQTGLTTSAYIIEGIILSRATLNAGVNDGVVS